MGTATPPFRVEPASAGIDLERLTFLVNEVYRVAEAGLWHDGPDRPERTDPAELGRLVAAGEIVVARLVDEVVGCVRVRRVAEDTGELGMLVADPRRRGSGLGGELVRFAERTCATRGLATMELELLVPRAGEHPVKRFLADWYGRLGYRVTRRRPAADAYPALAPALAVPCDFLTFRRTLRPPAT
ncbi:MAG TPA: GNAT family N-acetyltransferase [Pseudonocardia sp.]|jgi:GNAT superfamily N-acetyltransferase